jgi:hypothetical protein
MTESQTDSLTYCRGAGPTWGITSPASFPPSFIHAAATLYLGSMRDPGSLAALLPWDLWHIQILPKMDHDCFEGAGQIPGQIPPGSPSDGIQVRGADPAVDADPDAAPDAPPDADPSDAQLLQVAGLFAQGVVDAGLTSLASQLNPRGDA